MDYNYLLEIKCEIEIVKNISKDEAGTLKRFML